MIHYCINCRIIQLNMNSTVIGINWIISIRFWREPEIFMPEIEKTNLIFRVAIIYLYHFIQWILSNYKHEKLLKINQNGLRNDFCYNMINPVFLVCSKKSTVEGILIDYYIHNSFVEYILSLGGKIHNLYSTECLLTSHTYIYDSVIR